MCHVELSIFRWCLYGRESSSAGRRWPSLRSVVRTKSVDRLCLAYEYTHREHWLRALVYSYNRSVAWNFANARNRLQINPNKSKVSHQVRLRVNWNWTEKCGQKKRASRGLGRKESVLYNRRRVFNCAVIISAVQTLYITTFACSYSFHSTDIV